MQPNKQKKLDFTIFDYGNLLIKKTPVKKIEKIFGFSTVNITYADKSRKIFDLKSWFNCRERILKNLFDRNLCEIKFITTK